MVQSFTAQKQTFFDAWAPRYDCLLTTVFYQAIHQRMLEFADVPPGGSVLDLGCGTGRLLQRLARQYPELRGTGVDLSPQMVAAAAARNGCDRLQFTQGNAEALPAADAAFDAVFSTISFLHYPNPAIVMAEISRVLKPNGCFYWADYSLPDVWQIERLPFTPGGLRIYSPEKREALGCNAGLTPAGHHYLLSQVILTRLAKPD
jgi:ubiquinone/menaquinone biosynthesis C-methylase UbiE